MEKLTEVYNRLKKNAATILGYPVARDFSYQEFAPFLDLCINNVGDPETPSTSAMDTKDIEKECVAFFAEMLSSNMQDVWGYITNGGTEGNLYGLYLARESFPNAIVYYSETTHYSVHKNLHLLNINNIVIKSQDNGEMDYDDLEQVLMLHRHRPAIFFLNIGTTMTEAIDNLDEIKRIIKKFAIKDYYIHCDAAFLGLIAPFLDPKPKFDFAEGVDSIAISGHKFIGSPVPCGVVLAKRKHRNRIANSVSYIGAMDTTITGSRNGLTPLFIWSFIKKQGVKGIKDRIKNSLELASYTTDKLNELGVKAWRNKNALTVVFNKPSDKLCKAYQLASEKEIAHIICAPGVEKKDINLFLKDLKAEIATPETAVV